MNKLNTIIFLIVILSCEKQETPIQDQPDTLNLKNAKQGELFNIEVDSSFTDTVVIKITE